LFKQVALRIANKDDDVKNIDIKTGMEEFFKGLKEMGLKEHKVKPKFDIQEPAEKKKT
jgi:hypothetical protein